MTIQLPEDKSRSRLKAPTPETDEDFATAKDRIAAFWERYPNGSILPAEPTTADIPGGREYTVRAFVRKDSSSDSPDTTAHATRGTDDPDPIVARYPQESAETSAISRALRFLGILVNPTKPAAAVATPATPSAVHPLTAARKAAGLSQAQLAKAMQGAGFDWSQTLVSKVENGTRNLTDEEVEALTELISFGASS